MKREPAMLAYFQGQIRPLEDAKISITSHIVNYGMGAFAGLRAYWNDNDGQLLLFRPVDHFERLRHAAKILCSDDLPPAKELSEITKNLLRANNLQENSYCRAIFYKGAGGLGARAHGVPGHFCLYVEPFAPMPVPASGLRVATSSWRRMSDCSIPARGKICGAYVNSALAKSEAVLAGYDEPLLLDELGHVSEGAAANIFMVKDGVVSTPPVYADILEGVTRRTVIELARDILSKPVVERPMDRSELYGADELFFCGTGREIAPIGSLDSRQLGRNTPGPVTQQLSKLYQEIVCGMHAKYRERWCEQVYSRTEEK